MDKKMPEDAGQEWQPEKMDDRIKKQWAADEQSMRHFEKVQSEQKNVPEKKSSAKDDEPEIVQTRPVFLD